MMYDEKLRVTDEDDERSVQVSTGSDHWDEPYSLLTQVRDDRHYNAFRRRIRQAGTRASPLSRADDTTKRTAPPAPFSTD